MRTSLLVALVLPLGWACDSKPEHEYPPAANTDVPGPAGEPATAAVEGPREPPDQGLVQEDYQAQAEAQITADNLDQELEAIEKEILQAEGASVPPAKP